jgi:phosphohistidine phosphatase
MFIYLLRHAVAVDRDGGEYPNDDRPLTKDGREKMVKAAQGIRRMLDEPVDAVLTSPLVRARDTARIAADALGCADRVTICAELSPGTPYEKLLTALSHYKEREQLVLVGHAPDLNFIASAMLGSRTAIVDLKKGGLCCIELPSLDGAKPGTLQWLLQPKQLRQLAK